MSLPLASRLCLLLTALLGASAVLAQPACVATHGPATVQWSAPATTDGVHVLDAYVLQRVSGTTTQEFVLPVTPPLTYTESLSPGTHNYYLKGAYRTPAGTTVYSALAPWGAPAPCFTVVGPPPAPGPLVAVPFVP